MPSTISHDALFDGSDAHLLDEMATTVTKKPKLKLLTCTHCGNGAGRFEQWWNNDTGFGACRPCIDWVAGLRGGMTAEQIKESYGIEGRHYAADRKAEA